MFDYTLIVLIDRFVGAFLFALPLYILNALPTTIWYFETGGKKGKWKLKKKGISKYDFAINKELFGEHRTFYSILEMLCFGPIITFLLGRGLLLGLIFGIGMIAGHLGSSFIKRRLSIKAGASFPFLDQLDLIFGPQIVYYLIYLTLFHDLLLIVLITLILHPISCIIGYVLGVKEQWW